MKRIGFLATLALLATFNVPASAETDPFPGIATGQEIPGTRTSSAPGESWESFNAGAGANHSCPAGSGSGMGVDLNFTSSQSDDIRYYYCVKTWQPSSVTSAWDTFNQQVDAAISAAEAESRAWNAANPGKQKCVAWGPFTDPNGGTRSGGVCANPVQVPGGAPTQDAGSIGEDDVADGIAGLTPSPTNPLDPSPTQSAADAPRGSGYPFTVVLAGQLAASACPAGFQAANGVIVDVSKKKEFTECWPTKAWAAHQLGGDAWDLFKATGGSYDPAIEIDRRAKVDLLKAKAKEVALIAANQTPGIERCSSWSGYGETGKECAYVFIDPATQERNFSNESSDAEDSDASVDVGLDSVSVSGTSIKVASFALSITPNKSEARAISKLVNQFTSLKSTQRSAVLNLPKNSKLKYSVKSLSNKACKVTKSALRISSKASCSIEIKITDSVGNTYAFTKKIRRTA